ncbi:MAG: hypothetical protein RJB60_697 [Pseudomonadota bacterium]|jgi:uncharacterized protein YidB (DUF937 family)
MGLLDSVLGMAQQALSGQNTEGGASPDLLQAALGMLNSDAPGGGIGGLVQAFQEGGLGNVVQSWIGTGQNLPISAEQLQSVLGGEGGPLAQIAGKLGMNPADVAGHLSQILPQLVDTATPDGQLPQGGGLGALAGLASQFLGSKA